MYPCEEDKSPEILHSIEGEPGIHTTEEFVALLDQEWHRPAAWARRVFHRIVSWLPNRWRDLEAFVQRGRRGWADRDTWNLDYYYARVIGQSLAYLAEHGHGYPGEHAGCPEGQTPSAWRNYQRRLALAFLDYALASEQMRLDAAEYERLVATMRGLFDHYDMLWD